MAQHSACQVHQTLTFSSLETSQTIPVWISLSSLNAISPPSQYVILYVAKLGIKKNPHPTFIICVQRLGIQQL